MKKFLISYFSPFFLLWRAVLIAPAFYGLMIGLSMGGLPFIPVGMILAFVMFSMGSRGILPRSLEFYGTMALPWLFAGLVISGASLSWGISDGAMIGLMTGISIMVALRPWGMGPNIHDINARLSGD